MRLINADELYRKVDESKQHNHHNDGKLHTNHYAEHNHFLKMILETPIIKAEPTRCGHWSEKMVAYQTESDVEEHGDLHFGFQCSECKAVLNKTKFCGNCGAKMYISIKDIIDYLLDFSDKTVIFDTFGNSKSVLYLDFAQQLSYLCDNYCIDINMSAKEAISYCETGKKSFEKLGYTNVGYEEVIKILETLVDFEEKIVSERTVH